MVRFSPEEENICIWKTLPCGAGMRVTGPQDLLLWTTVKGRRSRPRVWVLPPRMLWECSQNTQGGCIHAETWDCSGLWMGVGGVIPLGSSVTYRDIVWIHFSATCDQSFIQEIFLSSLLCAGLCCLQHSIHEIAVLTLLHHQWQVLALTAKHMSAWPLKQKVKIIHRQNSWPGNHMWYASQSDGSETRV